MVWPSTKSTDAANSMVALWKKKSCSRCRRILRRTRASSWSGVGPVLSVIRVNGYEEAAMVVNGNGIPEGSFDDDSND